jgi:hypothetical protein
VVLTERASRRGIHGVKALRATGYNEYVTTVLTTAMCRFQFNIKYFQKL